MATAIEQELRSLVGADAVLPGSDAAYLSDLTEERGLGGHADAVVLPASPDEVAEVVAWCYEAEVPIVPRGGGTGFAGGAVPFGGVVLSLERMAAVRSFDPLVWRIEVEAGVRTADLRRIVRESGLFFPPDPGAAEQSHIGGNIATNAGGPHAFKYGVTGSWVMGLEAVLAPGEVVRVGGPVRKDVAGYDLKRLLIGSEGTLGVITAAWLRLLPAPEVFLPVVAFYGGIATGAAALERVVANGLVVAALEYLEGAALAAAGGSFPEGVPPGATFLVVAEADGSRDEAARLRDDVVEALAEGALAVRTPEAPADVAALWRWREGVSFAVTARRGSKVSEDIALPFDRIAEGIEGTVEIGRRHALEACSWGHAGDGNLHSTFLMAPDDPEELARCEQAVDDLVALALRLGGSISGEHGVGVLKRAHVADYLAPSLVSLQAQIKRAFDPKGLFNPGKKL
jgi:glycolate dehydrogenase FAD-linked subunit